MLLNVFRQLSAAAVQKGRSLYNLQTLSLLRCTSASTYHTQTPTSVAKTKFTPSFVELSKLNLEKSMVFDNPLSQKSFIKEVPFKTNLTYIDEINLKLTIDEPTKVVEKQAARLIVIRRRKMKRHKLKKLRIKMKFEWAKVRQRRELRKEKAFQAELMGKIRETEKFNPSLYASEKINKANEVLLPKLWKGKRLPEFLIKELIIERDNKMAKKKERIERRKKVSFNVTDYKV